MLRPIEERLLAWLLRRTENRGGSGPPMPPGMTSRRDALTNLLHRVAFVEDVRQARTRGPLGAILTADIDLFKQVNDRHGHLTGDEVIRTLADRLRAQLPPDSLAGRLGGEEFVAFVPSTLERACDLARQFLVAARTPIALPDSTEVHVTVSIGVASLSEGTTVDQTLVASEQALYAAKHAGRNRVQVFDDDTKGVVTARRSLMAALATLQERNRELQRRVEIDALTGLQNRHALDQILATTCGGPTGEWPTCSVAFLDIDHFGDYNHHHGDSRGDQVLRTIAQTIRTVARKGDLVFRKGGEEIVVVLPSTARDEANAAAERMRHAVESLEIPHAHSAVAAVMTVTVGVASTSAGTTVSVQRLMERASDRAMNAKVANARNRVHAD
ncbi:MAG: diguanylate cyclase [Comamonadaceae bacterium]|nr:diguanylate cyclase [Comamonadaceae bacterium]